MSKQSLDERFGKESLLFVQALLRDYMAQQVTALVDPLFLKRFNHVRIGDSTRFDVPEEFKEFLTGFNGRASSAAGISIQYEYDAKSGQILCMEVGSATKSDSKHAASLMDAICEGDLVIRDLGYYSRSNLLGIKGKRAFFISRLNAKAKVYTEDSQGNLVEVPFGKLYQEMSSSRVSSKEIDVFIGKSRECPARLVVQVMPDEVYEKRVRKLNAYNKANGHQTGQDIKERYRFNLFVTNVSQEDMSLQEICLAYKIRWQVELTFKVWKSGFKIASLQKMKYYRYMTVLHAKLLLIFIGQQIIVNTRHVLWRAHSKLLSLFKCFGTLFINNDLYRKMVDKPKKVLAVLKKIEFLFLKNHWQEKRKKRTGLDEIIDLLCCNSNIYTYI